MLEQLAKHEPPTYFANLATVTLNVDELTMEFRRYMFPHRELLKTPQQPMKTIPLPSREEMAQLEPIVRVVVTFTAAKALKQYLDQILPQIEQQRKTQ